MGTSAFAARMGQGKTKTLQAGLQDFCFFLPIPARWDHPCPSAKSVVSSSPTAPRPLVAEDWYRSAKVLLGSADRLYPLEGSSESVIELLQESAERYLKGYLISKGWALSRIHDLGAINCGSSKV